MALELHIFMNDSRVPDRETWQGAIDDLGFPTQLDVTLDLRHDTGFSPTIYKGTATGFEFYLEPAADFTSSYPQVSQRIGDRDMSATFRWGGDLNEMAAALSAAAALAKLTDGIYFYPDDDIFYSADAAVDATKRDLASL